MHLCDGTYLKFQVKTVMNTKFSNREEYEWIKCADVTFSIVVFTNALIILKTAKIRSSQKNFFYSISQRRSMDDNLILKLIHIPNILTSN